MAAEAFGSPVVVNVVGSGTIALKVTSGSGRPSNVACRRLFDGDDNVLGNRVLCATNGMVQLLADDDNVVGIGVVDTSLTSGDKLHQVKLRPYEIAIRVTHVVDETKWVGEVVGEYLSNCIDKVIQWWRSSIRWARPSNIRTTRTTSTEGQNFSFPPISTPQFDFHDNEEDQTYFDVTPPSQGERSMTEQSSPMTQACGGSMPNVGTFDGMPTGLGRRRYSMTNRRARERGPREHGEALSQKVTLESVLIAKDKGGCKCNCLRSIDAKCILDQRYMAWGQKYEARSTWIMQMLNVFFTRSGRPTKDKYVTKLDGVLVCNACYATLRHWGILRDVSSN